MQLFSEYVIWNNYLDVARVDSEVEEANADTAIKVEEATAMLGAAGTHRPGHQGPSGAGH